MHLCFLSESTVGDGTARENAMQDIFAVLLLAFTIATFVFYKWAGGPTIAKLGPGTWNFASLLKADE